MRIFGHPVHVMLVHFPVALWPAHGFLHLFASRLPENAAASVGFWLLVVGTLLGWLAAISGLTDLVGLWQETGAPRVRSALIHAVVNGSALIGFSIIVLLEYIAFPVITHGVGFLIMEAALIIVMLVGNYFGGAVIWRKVGVAGKISPV